ncbi:hypothetical protein [Crocosphaera sp. XPORK-15E]|uniref:hypothetical protein n=1 Tax=Crocosphaera sp. XPORK-15E TaxID=3110247 RepID=UPI002B2043BC|nr:hypothetical protein [Crocosphaera sp. XPORK-15E]MEA5534532.1 hypothetical protein [Crocosphaera sp. XPORK-15E]
MNSLNPEEKNILDSVEQGEWQSVDHLSEEINRYREYANRHINRQTIEVMLSVEDARKIQGLAHQLGTSVVDLSQEILHRYLQGEFQEIQ